MLRMFSLFLALICLAPSAGAAVTLPSVFGDHMVLQRDKEVRVWGKADPGEGVHIGLHVVGSSEERGDYVKADKNGNWHFMLPAQKGGVKCEIKVWSDADAKKKTKIVFKDVIFGEVWVASGQSNMAFTVAGSNNAEEEIANSGNDQIRMWTARRTVSTKPAFDVAGGWAVASPKTTGSFSAVAYYFARKLQQELGVPVGILHSSWGGTPVEAWTSRDKLESIDGARPILQRYDAAVKAYPKAKKAFDKAFKRWQETRNGPKNTGEKAGYAKPKFDDSKWKTMKLPQAWENAGLNKDGVVWFRRTIQLPEGLATDKLRISLGPIDDGETTYINGVRVGHTDASARGGWQRVRVYDIPAKAVKDRNLSIAVRVVDLSGAGGIWGKPEQLTLMRQDGQGETISLAGDWKYHLAAELTAKNRPTARPNALFGPEHPHAPAGLFNGMIAPIVPYTIRGAIWYQGESNSSRAQQYRKLFPGMIEDWRKRWGQGDFPFLFVQLANYRKATDKVVDTDWAHLRDAQLHTLRTVKNTGMAVTIDIGDARDIHPRNKQDVGKRLARWALADTYGKKEVVKSGPSYLAALKVQAEDLSNRIMVQFDTQGDLKVRGGGAPMGFTIAGEDKKFYKANAVLMKNSTGHYRVISLWSDKVKDPVAVRYAWEDNPDEANLINEEGLPASPFRTDDCKGPTDGRR